MNSGDEDMLLILFKTKAYKQMLYKNQYNENAFT